MLGNPSLWRGKWCGRWAAAALTCALGCAALLAQSKAPAAGNGAGIAEVAAPGPRVWLGPANQPLPFSSDEEVLEFLRTARVVSMERVPVGITAPQKVLLEKDGVQAHAHFSSIDEDKPMVTLRNGKREMGFRDSYRFQAAAYELARLLALDNVPPAVPRSVRNQRGALSMWVEAAFTEKDRVKRKQPPPHPQQWVKEMQNMHVFDNLIYNTDRNQGNILIGSDWKLWMIDHTRAFRRQESLQEPEKILGCGQKLWERLKSVSDAEIEQRLKPHITRMELQALLKRRLKLMALIGKFIAEKGEGAVLFREK